MGPRDFYLCLSGVLPQGADGQGAVTEPRLCGEGGLWPCYVVTCLVAAGPAPEGP